MVIYLFYNGISSGGDQRGCDLSLSPLPASVTHCCERPVTMEEEVRENEREGERGFITSLG